MSSQERADEMFSAMECLTAEDVVSEPSSGCLGTCESESGGGTGSVCILALLFTTEEAEQALTTILL